jgi:hypothetical protein
VPANERDIEPSDEAQLSAGPSARAEEPSRGETLSACVITRDEERRLPRCLESLRFCDEVVVVDSGSEDGTVRIAQSAGAVVVQNPWPGFAAQRNVAIDHASGDWILEVDADEWLTCALVEEIELFLWRIPSEVSIAVLPMRQRFLGATLGPSAHYPFYRPRMFRRGVYRHDEDRVVHEGLYARTRPWVFSNDMHHELAEGWAEALTDGWAYARLEASQLEGSSLRACLTGLFVRPPLKFVYQFVLLGGWRDGWRGTCKMALDSLVDALVWLRCLYRISWAGRPTHEIGQDEGDVHTGCASRGRTLGAGEPLRSTAAGQGAGRVHYGRRKDRVGPVRIALICSARALASARVARWLADSEQAGIWVTVINSSARVPAGVRQHRVARLGPLLVMRALDAERQLGPLDGVVGVDWWIRPLLRLIPSTLRSYSPIMDLDEPAPVR